MPGMSHLLSGVDKVGEIPPSGLSKGGHVFRRIVRVRLGIIGVNRNKIYSATKKFSSQSALGAAQVNDVGTVVARKNHEQRLPSSYLSHRPSFAVRIGQGEIWGY